MTDDIQERIERVEIVHEGLEKLLAPAGEYYRDQVDATVDNPRAELLTALLARYVEDHSEAFRSVESPDGEELPRYAYVGGENGGDD